jgi:HK97 family phage portal protein
VIEFGSDSSLGAFGPWPGIVNDYVDTGIVTRDQAEGLPGIGRGVRLMSGVVSQLPMVAYRGLTDPTAPNAPLEKQPTVLRNPSPGNLRVSGWLGAVVADLCWYGNAFAYRGPEVCDSRGWPLQLPLISATQVVWNGNSWKWEVGPNRKEVDQGDLLHFQINARSGDRLGRGILAMYQDTLRLIKATEHASHIVMAHGRPVGVISLEGDPTPQQASDYKVAFLKAMREGSVAAMSRARFEAVQWNAQDLALVPMREYNLRLASDILNITPYLLGVPSESRVYSNMETEWSSFMRTSLGTYVEAINDAMSTTQPNGVEVRISTDALLRADTKTRWEVYDTAVAMGALTTDEVRRAEGLAPISDSGGLIDVKQPKPEVQQ